MVVLGYDFWRTRLGADPGVVNRTLIVNGGAMTIVGVAPSGFTGLTALSRPQVFVPLRIFVFRVPSSRAEQDPGDIAVGNTVMINPQIELMGEERVLGWEGCLSIPGMRAGVPRAHRIRYFGMDCDGNVTAREVTGFHARVVQHEYDHLDGILYTMRLTDFSLFGFNEELNRAAEEAEARAEAGA